VCAPLGKTQATRTFQSTAAGQRAFKAYAKSQSRNATCFVLMLKPSSIGYAMDLVNQLHEARVTVGYEALEEEYSVFE